MILTYGNYIELLSALDEHCKGSLEKSELQNAIFKHFMSRKSSFVAENAKGNKQLFTVYMYKTKNNAAEQKKFRNFMNVEVDNTSSKGTKKNSVKKSN